MFWNSQWQSAQLRIYSLTRQKLALLHLFTDLFLKAIFLTLKNMCTSEENFLMKQIFRINAEELTFVFYVDKRYVYLSDEMKLWYV